MQATYIGAGLDVRPLVHLHEIDEFVYIDGLPAYNCGDRRTRPTAHFLTQLDEAMRMVGFEKVQDGPCITFTQGPRRVRFYHSIVFPDDVDAALAAVLAKTTHLIAAGHDPHAAVLDYLSASCRFVGYSDTYYGLHECETPSTFQHLHDAPRRMTDYLLLYSKDAYTDDWPFPGGYSVRHIATYRCHVYKNLSDLAARL